MTIESFRAAYEQVVAAEQHSEWAHGLYPGMTVETTGIKETARWKGYRGTILQIVGDRVQVTFNHIGTVDLAYSEVRPYVRSFCPCAACTWSREHH